MTSFFCCPVCGNELNIEGQCAECSQNHCFDLAKEGYLHLLPSNKMHSKLPGDTKQMINSRRSFLESGAYDIFLNAICDEIGNVLSGKITLLDVGCGEGYYTKGVYDSLKGSGCEVEIAGVDISKFAVKAAAKKYRDIQFAVASAFGLPVTQNKCDCVLNVFAPLVPSELRRVLKAGGYMLLAVPGARHLWGLKELVYDEPYENEVKDTRYDGFEFIKRVSVKGELELSDNQMIQNLFSMTPYYWKTSVEGSERIMNAQRLNTLIHFDLLLYKAV